MYDYHLHSSVSFDTKSDALLMVKKAEEIGLKEICFTDHYDYWPDPNKRPYLFSLKKYNETYNSLLSDKLKIRKGVEFGLTDWNTAKLEKLLQKRNFDFVIGSFHYLKDGNPYRAPYWSDKTLDEAIEQYFEEMYRSVRIHSKFNVLGHLTYISKCPPNPSPAPIMYKQYSDIIDEIFKELIYKGIGLEVNTSGVDSAGVFLPDKDYLKRFRELGGEIVTIGSDSHDENRVGQYSKEALEMLKEIFGYVCTFENRKPIFNKLYR